MATKRRPLQFPKDELKHDHGVEWWYWNGNMQDTQGNDYAFMHCLFRTDISKFKTPLNGMTPHIPFYFSHSVITDIGRKKAYPHINYAALVTKDSFTKQLLHIHYANPIPTMSDRESTITEPELFSYEIQAEQLDIRMTAIKQPISLGENGYMTLQNDSAYYYSIPRLALKGSVKVGKQWIQIKGAAWMDHQWMNPRFLKDAGWSWFSIQLSDKTDIVCFKHTTPKGETNYGHISRIDGTQVRTENVILTPVKQWTSRTTKTKYPLEWRIELPDEHISLTIAPRVSNQEMLFAGMHYWEGPTQITGSVGKKKVTGLGFMELVGYRSRYSNIEFIEEMTKGAIKLLAQHAKDVIHKKNRLRSK
jgi:predicted secreted hydrolase